MDTKRRGIITEIETMMAFVKQGYPVLIPYGNNERYDYVVDVNGRFIRIQVKSAFTRDGGKTFKFDARSNKLGASYKAYHTYYSSDEIDYFATSWNGKCYLLSVDDCKSGAVLRMLPPERYNQYDVRWAEDYELEKVIETW